MTLFRCLLESPTRRRASYSTSPTTGIGPGLKRFFWRSCTYFCLKNKQKMTLFRWLLESPTQRRAFSHFAHAQLGLGRGWSDFFYVRAPNFFFKKNTLFRWLLESPTRKRASSSTSPTTGSGEAIVIMQGDQAGLVIVLLLIVQAWRIRAFDIPDAHQHHLNFHGAVPEPKKNYTTS